MTFFSRSVRKIFFSLLVFTVLTLVFVNTEFFSFLPAQLLEGYLRSGGEALQEGLKTARNTVSESVQEIGEEVVRSNPGLNTLSEESGFYLSLYRDTVQKPQTELAEHLKNTYRLDFRLQLAPLQAEGVNAFSKLYEYSTGDQEPSFVPEIITPLVEACVRIQAAESQKRLKRWQLLQNRLQGRSFDTVEETALNQESENRKTFNELAREVGDIYNSKQKLFTEDLKQFVNINDANALRSCYQKLQDDMTYESKLFAITEPLKKQTAYNRYFYNGILETDIKGLPVFDVLFDIDVVENILFGRALDTEALRSLADAHGEGLGLSPGTSTVVPQRGNSLPQGAVKEATDTPLNLLSTIQGFPVDHPDTGFGGLSTEGEGLFCPIKDGLVLDYSPQEQEGEILETLQPSSKNTVLDQRGLDAISLPSIGSIETLDIYDPGVTSVDASSTSNTGVFASQQACSQFISEGNIIQLLLCIGIDFTQAEDTWEYNRDDCIACSIREINRVFEEDVLSTSIRPHKNTGTIMESGLCEDAYSSDVLFNTRVEFVPIRLYDEVCFPEGGVDKKELAGAYGYPSLLAQLQTPGSQVDCLVDFVGDPDAVERCTEAFGGKEVYTYKEFVEGYIYFIKREFLQDGNAVSSAEETWKRLQGAEGVSRHAYHFFLFLLGEHPAWYSEESRLEIPPVLQFQKRKEQLARLVQEVLQDDSLLVSAEEDQKTSRLLCLEGLSDADFCSEYPDTSLKLQHDKEQFRHIIAQTLHQSSSALRVVQKQSQCSPFAAGGLGDDFLNLFEERIASIVTDDDYYYSLTDPVRSQEQFTQQYLANTDIQDFSQLLQTVNTEIGFLKDRNKEKLQQELLAQQQAQAVTLRLEIENELKQLKTYFDGWRNTLSDIVRKPQFVSKSGKSITWLESLFEKVR